MSVAAGKRIFAHFCSNHLKKLSTRSKIVRFSSVVSNKSLNLEENAKCSMSTCESNKISAAVLKKFSDPFVLESIEPPKVLQANEVLVDVRYCALNASDALLSKNMYTFEPTLPVVLGYELVGKLVQVGEEAEKQGYKVGDKIVALNKERYGGLAEQCVAEVNDIWKVPSEVQSIDVVGLLDDYITALIALESKVSIQEEDIMLINVGVSSIGLAAVDLATNVFKAEVISVSATEDGAALARDKGVLASFKYKDKTLLKQIEKVAAEKDIKEIFDDDDDEISIKDLLNDDNFAVVLHHLSREGRVIIAGSAVTLKSTDSDIPKDVFTISGFNLKEYKKKKPELYRQAGDDVLQFLEEGLITPTSALTVGLSKINDALEFILTYKSPGKVSVIIDVKDR
ncbi:hypothetical protein E2986_07071 [Frieseomelitta varia]|uniref:Enoyl reductase (ER) domain-containing protein n=1 Tax=Frieseomelitta varia TaxID=561572 RepID=A0A833RBT3_9HYME|nr:hypothetical protein E2986_07071 [Frieseomelitta varia]